MIRRLASLHWLQRGEVRQLPRYFQDAMTSCCPSRRTSFPSLGDTSVSLAHFAPWRTSAPPRPGVDNPGSPAGILPRRQQDLPSSWGTSLIRLHMFQTDAGRTACTRPSSAAAWPLVIQEQRLPRLRLSTLNSMAFGLAVYASPRSLPHSTQNSLPVAGQALLDGVLTRKVPLKGFRVVNYISFPFPKLCLAQLMHLLEVPASAKLRRSCVPSQRFDATAAEIPRSFFAPMIFESDSKNDSTT